MITRNKHLSVEYNEENKFKTIDNLWYCTLDEKENVLKYNTEDDTMTLKEIDLAEVDRFSIYIITKDSEEPNTSHWDCVFQWDRDFERNFNKWND